WKAGDEPKPRKIGRALVNEIKQIGKCRRSAVAVNKVVMVDRLPEQRDLFDASVNELAHFVDDVLRRPMHFRAARVRNNTIGAELVAPAGDPHISLRNV